MTPSRDLFDLIHSLNATEKRYVRRSARLSGRNAQWLKLFDAIEKQSVFNDQDLRDKLKGAKMLANLSEAKKYTHQAVLRALQSYGVGSDFDSELGEMIEQYKVLVHKGLHQQASRRLTLIKQRALEGDAYLRLFWAIIRQFGAGAQSNDVAAMDHLEATLAEQQHVIRCIENYSLSGGVYFRQRIILRHRPNARSAAEQKILYRIVEPLLELKPEQLLSPTASGFYHLALADYWEAIGQPEQARSHLDGFLDSTTLDYPIGVTDALHLAEFTNALFFRLRNLMIDDLEIPIDELRRRIGKPNVQGKFAMLQIWYYERWLVASLMLFNLKGEISLAGKLLTKEKTRIDSLIGLMSKKLRLQLLHTIASTRLAQGDHASAIVVLNTVLNDSETSTEEYGRAKLLSLVAHIEASNTEWLEAALRSTTRNLRSHARYHKTEQTIVSGLHQVLKSKSETEKRAAYRKLHGQLRLLFNDPRERAVSSSIDLLSWTSAHAQGKSFSEFNVQQSA